MEPSSDILVLCTLHFYVSSKNDVLNLTLTKDRQLTIKLSQFACF